LALAELPVAFWDSHKNTMKRDRETITCLRSVLMKPEHLDWVGRIWEVLTLAAEETRSRRLTSA